MATERQHRPHALMLLQAGISCSQRAGQSRRHRATVTTTTTTVAITARVAAASRALTPPGRVTLLCSIRRAVATLSHQRHLCSVAGWHVQHYRWRRPALTQPQPRRQPTETSKWFTGRCHAAAGAHHAATRQRQVQLQELLCTTARAACAQQQAWASQAQVSC